MLAAEQQSHVSHFIEAPSQPINDNNSSIIERPRFDQISDATKYVVNTRQNWASVHNSNTNRQETSGYWPKNFNMDHINSPP